MNAPAPKPVHLVCNAHLDPVWLWQWEDGLTEAISTFRVAARFCEKHEGFVFCHNESILYETVEQADPDLFQHIQKLVQEKKWHIAGGAYLQPDVNNPSGESHIRQILLGKNYFRSRFGVEPTTAYNFDSFGHTEGFPQILKGCGYDSYIFCRPPVDTWDLPVGAFHWIDRSGSSVVARRSDDHYQTLRANMYEKLEKWLAHFQDEDISLILWGIGNHGGGVSEQDFAELQRFVADHPEYRFIQSTPENFFSDVKRAATVLPRVHGPIERNMPGTYSVMSRVKRAHRRAESAILALERLASLSWWIGSQPYPQDQFGIAWKKILFTQFHDILSGTCIERAERDALEQLAHATDIVREIRFRLWPRLLANQPIAGKGDVPLFFWNPHSFPVHTVVECNYVMTNTASWRGHARITLKTNGRKLTFQREKEDNGSFMDFAIKVAVPVRLKPFGFQRIDASYVEDEKQIPWVEPAVRGSSVHLESKEHHLRISTKTGLVISYSRTGEESNIATRGALCPVVFSDSDHTWWCGQTADNRDASDMWGKPAGKFVLAKPEQIRSICRQAFGPRHEGTIPSPVHIVEDGPVRTVVEVFFAWNNSHIVRQYVFSKVTPEFHFEDRVFWAEADMALKIEVPLAFRPGSTISESTYSAATRAVRNGYHDEWSNQRWTAATEKGNRSRFVAVVNEGSSGGHSVKGKSLYITVLRSAAHASFGLKQDRDVHVRRYIPRIDRGEHCTKFRLLSGKRFEEQSVVQAAELCGAPPDVFVFYPGGTGEGRVKDLTFVTSSKKNVLIAAVKKAEERDALVIRLRETAGKATAVSLAIAGRKKTIETRIGAWGIQTLLVEKKGAYHETNLIEQKDT